MVSYLSECQEFWNCIPDFGLVLYGLTARSQELLDEVQNEYENLLKDHIEVIDSLIGLCSGIAKQYNSSHDQGKRYLDSITMVHVVTGGHLKVLRSLCDGSLGEVYPLDPWSIQLAVDAGELEILRALRDGSLGEKCPWNKRRCRREASGHPEIIRLIDSGELD